MSNTKQTQAIISKQIMVVTKKTKKTKPKLVGSLTHNLFKYEEEIQILDYQLRN